MFTLLWNCGGRAWRDLIPRQAHFNIMWVPRQDRSYAWYLHLRFKSVHDASRTRSESETMWMIDICCREWWSMTVQSISVCIIRNGPPAFDPTLLILFHIYKVLGNRWTYREHYHLNHLCKRTWLKSFTSDRVRQPAASKDYSTIAIRPRTLKLASRAQERTPGTYSIRQTSLSSSGARAKNG